MYFWLKKSLSMLLLPLPISLLLIFIGLILLILMKHQALAIAFIVAGFIVLSAFSFSPLPNWMLRSLETRYPALTTLPKDIQTIVVLGGGERGGSHLPANSQLGGATLARLVEAIRLYQEHPDNTQLILSGGSLLGETPSSKLMQQAALALGVKQSHITLETESRNTVQEAKELKPKLGDKQFILVTSASHMPRAMALFQAQGMQPVAAPTQYLSFPNTHSVRHFGPNAANLIRANVAIHEELGIAWAKLRKFL